MTETFNDIYKRLSAVDVSKHVRQRTGFNYLSWSWAYALLVEKYPSALIEPVMYQNSDGTIQLHHPCPMGYMVMVSIAIEDVKRTEILPVLNYKNQAIETPTAMDINTSIKRCGVKCMALLGLGLNLFADEDLPMAYQEFTPEEYEAFEAMVDEKNQTPITYAAWNQNIGKDKRESIVNKWMEPHKKNKELGKAGDWLNELDKRGHAQADEYYNNFCEAIEKDDPALARENRDDLSHDEFALVWHRMTMEQRNEVKALLAQTAEST